LFSLLKESEGNGWRAGVMSAHRDSALALVRSVKGARPLLQHCTAQRAGELRPEELFAALANGPWHARVPVSGVISDYQLVQVEAPEVQPAEMRAAVRWALRDVINYPVTEAVVDVFSLPEQARYAKKPMVFAVAAHGEAVRRIVELVKPRARGFDVIDIPELCLRNLSALLPQDERGVALLALGDGYAQLVLTCQGALYLARRIDLGARSDTLSLEGGAESDTQALAIELQRSLNYYESHYDRAQISDVFVASGDARAQQLLEPLRKQTGLDCRLFDARELFDLAAGVEPDTHFSSLCALGAALRTERTRA
jgi:MSHA biogenesis protein MshI